MDEETIMEAFSLQLNYTVSGLENSTNETDNFQFPILDNVLVQDLRFIPLVLGILGALLNVISILAIFQVQYKWTSLFKFMLSLMISDITISMTVIILLFVRPNVQLSNEGTEISMKVYWCCFTTGKALFTMAMNVTLLNLMAMSLDHYVAIIYPLQYYVILNHRRCNVLIISLWIIAFITGFSNYFSPIWRLEAYRKYDNYSFCEFIFLTKYNEEYTTFVIAFLCAFVIVPVYLCIYCTAKRIISKDAETNIFTNRKIAGSTQNSRRSLVTVSLILGTFAVCWLPMCIFQITQSFLVVFERAIFQDLYTLVTADEILLWLLLFNPILDPLIYCIRIGEVRQGFLKLLHRFASKSFKERMDDPKSILNYRRYSINSHMLTGYKEGQVTGSDDGADDRLDDITEETDFETHEQLHKSEC